MALHNISYHRSLIFFILSFHLLKLANSTCPLPWKKIANSKWYLFAEDKRASFAAAKSYCKERGGYIVDITSESEYITLSIKLVDRKYSEGFYTRGIGSVWVSNETRPEHFSKKWRSRYAKGEPNHSGDCLYLSSSRSYKWRDTSCAREKGILCESNEALCHGYNHRRNEVVPTRRVPETPKRDDKKFVSVFDIEWGRKPSTREGVSKSKPEGIDERFARLTSKAEMVRNGWNADVDYSNGEDWSKAHERSCSSDTFYGYRGGDAVGSVSAIFKGSGKGILSYGNCYETGYVMVSLNGVEIHRSDSNSKGQVSFQYRRGDVLKIEEHETAIIKLYSLDLQDGVKPTCRTVENKDCAFPFIYRNKRYAGCTSDSDINDKLWCSTKTDQAGRHAGETNWGYCKEEECPIEKNYA